MQKGPYGGDTPGKILAYRCHDPFAFKYVKRSFDLTALAEQKLTVLLGSEIKTSWLEDNFLSLGLFGNKESFLIQNAEDLSEDVQQLILQHEEFILEGRLFVLNFNRDHKLFKSLQTKKTALVSTVLIKAPAFWEEMKLLNFLLHQKEMSLDYNVKDAFVDNVPFTFSAYCQTLDQLKISSPHLTKECLLALLGTTKTDQFAMIDFFTSRKMKSFYEKLIKVTLENGELIPLLYFLQNYFIKVYDPSYLQDKKKLSNYDRGILATSKTWKTAEIQRAIEYIGELIVLAKTGQQQLLNRLQLDQIKSIKI